MPPTIPQLKWVALTAAVNLIQSPNQFLKKKLFGNHVTLPTEQVEIGVYTKNRQAAPFVRKNGEALMVTGVGETFQVVEAPNIRLKRPFTPSELLFNRRPGSVVMPTAADMQTAINQHVARDLQAMANMATNAEEYLCALALQGVAAYQVADAEVFQITYQKPAANTITLTTFWDDPIDTNPAPEIDFLAAKRIVAQGPSGLTVTDCIMSASAAQAFLTTIRKQKLQLLTGLGIDFGTVTATQQFTDDGVLFLGTFCGIRCWEYSRTVNVNGTDTPLIPDKFVHFVCDSPAAENTLYYGAIPDLATFGALPLQSERFSKSWIENDPSVYYALLHTRPLPVPRKPSTIVTMKVVSG